MSHLAAAEAQASLHLVAAVQKFHSLIFLGLVIVLIHGNGELDFLDGDNLLLLAGCALALFLLVQETAVVLNAANRRLRVRRNFDQIQPALAGDLQRLKWRQNAELFTVFVDDADFACADAVVDAGKGLGCSFIECDGTPP